MKEIYTEIEIEASIEMVWRNLTDFEQYVKWNPFIKSIIGKVTVGEVIQISITPPGAKPMNFKPRVLKVEQESELSWLGHLFIPGIFDGEHSFKLIDLGNGKTKFVQTEIFRGVLVPLMQKMLDINTKNGFMAMNEKLKELCEFSQ